MSASQKRYRTSSSTQSLSTRMETKTTTSSSSLSKQSSFLSSHSSTESLNSFGRRRTSASSLVSWESGSDQSLPQLDDNDKHHKLYKRSRDNMTSSTTLLSSPSRFISATVSWIRRPRFISVVSFGSKEGDDSEGGFVGDDEEQDLLVQPDDDESGILLTTIPLGGDPSNRPPPPPRPAKVSQWIRGTSVDTETAVVAVQEFTAKREMTKTQEQWNALTMIPFVGFCAVYFAIPSLWIPTDHLEQARLEWDKEDFVQVSGFAGLLNSFVAGSTHGCFAPTPVAWWNTMPALPPIPALVITLGIAVHVPFSFLYHWKYAHSLAPAERLAHWSRRMDHAMIHIASSCISYGTSGSLEYYLFMLLFNTECAVHHFRPKIVPRSNQIRVLLAILGYSLPLLRLGSQGVVLFGQFWAAWMVGGWLFIKYPFGGWSHTAFHLVTCVTPLMLIAGSLLTGDAQEQLHLAAQCQLWREHL